MAAINENIIYKANNSTTKMPMLQFLEEIGFSLIPPQVMARSQVVFISKLLKRFLNNQETNNEHIPSKNQNAVFVHELNVRLVEKNLIKLCV